MIRKEFFKAKMTISKKSKFKVDRSKKGKEKRTFEGREFDSVMELQFYKDFLLPLKEKGEIKHIEFQPEYVLQEGFLKQGKRILPIKYVGDYEVEYSSGKIITFDVKGLPTPEAKLKRKLFDFKFPEKTLIWIALSIIDGGWVEYGELCKLRAKRRKAKINGRKQ